MFGKEHSIRPRCIQRHSKIWACRLFPPCVDFFVFFSDCFYSLFRPLRGKLSPTDRTTLPHRCPRLMSVPATGRPSNSSSRSVRWWVGRSDRPIRQMVLAPSGRARKSVRGNDRRRPLGCARHPDYTVFRRVELCASRVTQSLICSRRQ